MNVLIKLLFYYNFLYILYQFVKISFIIFPKIILHIFSDNTYIFPISLTHYKNITYPNLIILYLRKIVSKICLRIKQTVTELKEADIYWETIIVPIIKLQNSTELARNIFNLLNDVHTDKNIQDLCNYYTTKINKILYNEYYTNEIYQKIVKCEKFILTQYDKQLYNNILKNFDMAAYDTSELGMLYQKVDALRYEFLQNKNNIPDNKSENSFESERIIAYKKCYGIQEKKNIFILKKLGIIRNKIAQLNNKKSYAEMVLKNNMIKNTETVLLFLKEKFIKLEPILDSNNKIFLDLKQEQKKNEVVDSSQLFMHDLSYFNEVAEKKKISIENLNIHFEINKIIERGLDIFGQIFGLIFIKNECNKEIKKINICTKNPLVNIFSSIFLGPLKILVYNVYDRKSNKFMGTIFLDLFKRKYKCNSCACYNISSRFKEENVMNFPQVYISCLFESSYLNGEEYISFFHEFGHALHVICNNTDNIFFSSFNTENDFIEFPSRLLEFWCMKEEILRYILMVSDDVIQEIIFRYGTFSSWRIALQITLSLIDQHVHGGSIKNIKNITDIYKKILKNTIKVNELSDASFLSNFDHLFDYGGCYYTYLWSYYNMKKIYTKYIKNNKNPLIGIIIRNKLFSPGSSKSGEVILYELDKELERSNIF